MSSLYLRLNNNITITKTTKLISTKYFCKKINSENLSITFYDTFDWRLFKNDFMLQYSNQILELHKFDNDRPVYRSELEEVAAFVEDFVESKLKDRLIKINPIRALQSIVEVQCSSEFYRLLDDNDKTVLRMQYLQINGVGNYLVVNALRGYEKELVILKEIIAKISTVSSQKIMYEEILRSNQKVPNDYDPKIRIQLQPEMRSDIATKIILKNLFETLTKNERGILKDIDSEFLHDFRVASRRTRAALSQIKGVFNPEISSFFNSQFRMLGKKTNKLRDIDVYLLHKSDYVTRLPKKMQKNIEPFFEQLLKERKNEHKIFCRYLKSEDYKKLCNDWLDFLNSKNQKSKTAKNADKTIFELAKYFIMKQFNKVIKKGSVINRNSPDEAYHKLRIDCKKLRYLLEFFSSLFLQEKIDLLISHLKQLQDNLGLFNDLSVQQAFLTHYNQKYRFDSGVVLSLGYLIGKLNDEQVKVRSAFNSSFRKFSNKSNLDLFDELFKDEAGGSDAGSGNL